MKHDVEKVLQHDAKQMRAEQPPASDFEQIRAIRAGMQQPARRMNVVGRLFKGIRSPILVSVLSAVMVIAILVGVTYKNDQLPQTAAVLNEPKQKDNWGDLEPFRTLYINSDDANYSDPTYDSLNIAIKHNYVQRMNTSVTQNGLTFHLNAVTADQKQVIYFFTIESHTDQGILYPRIIRFINASTHQVVSEGSSTWGGTSLENPKFYRGIGIVPLDPSQRFPNKMTGHFQLRTAKAELLKNAKVAPPQSEIHTLPIFKIPFDLAPQFSLQQSQTYYPKDMEYTWENINLQITKVELLPLSTKIEMRLDELPPPIDYGVNYPRVYLLSEKGDTLTPINRSPNSGGGGQTADGSYHLEYEFGSDMLSDPDGLRIVLTNGQEQTLHLH